MEQSEPVGSIGELLETSLTERPDRPFLLFQSHSYSAAEFLEAAARAAGLFDKLGIRRGDRVALFLANRPELLIAWMGLARLGAVTVALHSGYTAAELSRVLEHAEPAALLVDAELGPAAASACDRLRGRALLLAVGGKLGGALDWDRALSRAPAAGLAAVSPEQPANILYTSGTTGAPKAVVQSHRTYVLTGRGFSFWLGLEPADRLYTCLPLSHINAQAYSFMGAVACGGSLALRPRFSASHYWEQVAAAEATVANTIGAMLSILSQRGVRAAERGHRLRMMYNAPALPPQQHLEFERRFGLRLVIGYGLSESTFGFIQPLRGERGLGTMGRPRCLPGLTCQVRLVDQRGRDCEAGRTGEIWLRNPATLLEYYRDPTATRAALQDGWLRTGDLARCDAAGFYCFVDRRKHMIRRRGENVSALEVESVIAGHPAVAEAAVVGIPSPLGEQDIAAFVVLKRGGAVLAQELEAHCRASLASFKVPTQWHFRARLPRTATQRIAKHRLA
jgi:crotonobetaine/carnitine-CoA ligase